MRAGHVLALIAVFSLSLVLLPSVASEDTLVSEELVQESPTSIDLIQIKCADGSVYNCPKESVDCQDFSPAYCSSSQNGQVVDAQSQTAPTMQGHVVQTKVHKVVNRVSVPTATIVKHVTDIVHTPAPPVVHDVLAYKVKRAHYDLKTEVVPAKPGPFIKIVKYRSPAPPGPVKVVYVPKPVPVPVPAPVPVHKVKCGIDVKSCFAHRSKDYAQLRLQKPIDHFRGSYLTMCTAEVAVKREAAEKKKKAETKHKELCVKREKDIKYSEKKLKLATKKEKASKKVNESKAKYLEKKVKSVEEATAKTLGVSKEKVAKSQEKADKREDELYKKECSAKEGAYKAVREGKQKMRVVYVRETVAPKPKPLPAPAPTKIVTKTVTYTPAPQPVPVSKTTIYVPAPVKTVEKPIVDSDSEVVTKSNERLKKNDAKSAEIVTKQDMSSEEVVTKESDTKKRSWTTTELAKKAKLKKEASCKERESKESKKKAEIEQKLAVEKVRKELAKKELSTKNLKKPVRKPCKPESSVESYVKSCKDRTERFAKSEVESEKKLKEVKVKARSDLEEAACHFSRHVCQEIYKASALREDKMVSMVNEHTKALEVALKNVDQKTAEEAAKEKYNICEQAAGDMKYFAKNFVFTKTGRGAPLLL